MPHQENGAAGHRISVAPVSPDNLNQLMTVVSSKDWIMLLAIALLLACGVAWSLVGEVPAMVVGRGVLARPRRIVAVEAQGAGRLAALNVQPGDTIRKGQVVGRLDQTELRQQIEDNRRLLSELILQDASKTASEEQRIRLQEQQNRLEQKFYEAQRGNLTRSLAGAESVAVLLQKRVQTAEALRKEGLLAEGSAEYAEVHLAFRDNESKISGFKAQLQQLDGQVHALEAQLSAIAQQNLESSTARRNYVAELRSRIAASELQLQKHEAIISGYAGRVTEIYVVAGQVVSPGARLFTLHLDDAASSLVSISYFPVKDGKKIAPGMAIQVTPDTVERSRFGGIAGRVLSVSPLPVTKEGAASTVGNPDVVQGLIGPGAWVEVTSELFADPSVPSGYRWSSSRGPVLKVSPGTTAAAYVTIERRAPVSYVLPALRDASGLY